MSGVELCWEARLVATCRRPIYVLMMSSQYDQRSLIEALELRRRRFHRQAASGRGALCAAPRRRADSLHAARVDPARHHRSLDRIEQSPRFLRARDGSLRARGSPDGSLSAIILDIDNFKHINDSYGHETGDEAICCCARAAFLTEAVVGRLGGDEFALLLEDRTLPQAIEIAENLRTRLAAQPFDTGKDRITLTWSVGVGEGRPGDSVDQILARADAALYDAKLGGRNRVVGAHAGILTRPAIVTNGLRSRFVVLA